MPDRPPWLRKLLLVVPSDDGALSVKSNRYQVRRRSATFEGFLIWQSLSCVIFALSKPKKEKLEAAPQRRVRSWLVSAGLKHSRASPKKKPSAMAVALFRY